MEFVAKIGGLLVDNANDGCQILQKSSLQARLSSLETDTFGIINCFLCCFNNAGKCV